jgi:hypothetical protein
MGQAVRFGVVRGSNYDDFRNLNLFFFFFFDGCCVNEEEVKSRRIRERRRLSDWASGNMIGWVVNWLMDEVM